MLKTKEDHNLELKREFVGKIIKISYVMLVNNILMYYNYLYHNMYFNDFFITNLIIIIFLFF